MLPAPPLTCTDCLIAADWCDDQGWSEYAERLRAMAVEPPLSNGSRLDVDCCAATGRVTLQAWTWAAARSGYTVYSHSDARLGVYTRTDSCSRAGRRTESRPD